MNIQQTILQGIQEQLYSNDFLVLPSFGGFVLRSMPSQKSASGTVLSPPAKTVGFNVQLRQNDGILSAWLQEKLKCSQSEAIQHLQEFSAYCQGILAAKRRLTLQGIGFFYLDFENNICFEPKQDVNFLSSSFGLSPLALRELEMEEPVLKKEPVQNDRVLAEVKPAAQIQTPKRRNRVLISGLAALVFVGFVFLLVSNNAVSGQLRSALLPGTEKSSYTPLSYPPLELLSSPVQKQDYVADANGIAQLQLETATSIAVKAVETPENTPVSTKTDISANTSAFEIVVGCFSIRHNAERMVQKVKPNAGSASISKQMHKGMFVVTAGRFNSKTEAVKQLEELKVNFPNAWIKQP